MTGKKILGGFIGFFAGIAFVFGWIPLILFLITRKQYKLLFIPFIFIVLVSIAGSFLENIDTKSNNLSDQIENNIFSVEYPVEGEYYNYSFFRRGIIRQFKTVTDITKYNEKLNTRLDLLASRLYDDYKDEFSRSHQDNETFTLSQIERKTIKKELNEFSHDYLLVNDTSLNVKSIIAWIIIAVSFIAGIIFSTVVFAKYLYQRKITYINSATAIQIKNNFLLPYSPCNMIVIEQEENGPFENMDDFILRSGLPLQTCEQIGPYIDFSYRYRTVRINSADIARMVTDIRLTPEHASSIIEERKANGPFVDMDNFISRTALSERLYEKIRPHLDFSVYQAPVQTPVEREVNIPQNDDLSTVRINYATAEEISENLRLTSIQSRKIINERNANGSFTDLNNFVSRSGLSQRICNNINPYLDFTIEEGRERRGRVIEF